MELLKTLLLYMALTVTASAQSTVLPVITPPPATPTPYYTQVPTATPEPTATPVPKPTITPSLAYTQLAQGDRGDDVLKMQQRLTELGYYDGELDGVFGAQTAGAVERFQYRNGLYRDGVAGKRTLTILYESPDVVYASSSATDTPAPTETPTATGAPTAEPPASTDAAVPAPVTTATPAVAQAPAALIPADSGYQLVEASEIYLNAEALPLKDENGSTLHLLRAEDDTLLLPLESILRLLGCESATKEGNARSWTLNSRTITIAENALLYGTDAPLLIVTNESAPQDGQTDQQDTRIYVDLQGNAYVYSPLLDTLLNAQYENKEGVMYVTLDTSFSKENA